MMNEKAERPGSILALDVGSGTQDLFLWRSGDVVENCVQMILPSPTTLLARRVREATDQGRPIHLGGHLMGGGHVSWAIRDHRSAGFAVTSEPEPALTIHDRLDHVVEMGIVIQDAPLDGALVISMGDIQAEALRTAMEPFDIEPPEMWCVAVQDHGYQPHGSNREFRFAHWRSFLEQGGRLTNTIYEEPPSYLTRMTAVLAQVPRGRVMDTGMAAIQGALCDPWVRAHLNEGVLVVNLGNQHLLAGLVTESRVWGLFEHHTGVLNQRELVQWIQGFRRGDLKHEEVLNDGGHGCAYGPDGIPSLGFEAVVVTGPQRAMAEGTGWTFAAPFGNMMLTGCFGLIGAFHRNRGDAWP
jgi:uncharacterized protein (DUF1786 family)